MIRVQGQVDVDKINAESYAEERRLRLQNQRQKDSEEHQRGLQSLNNQHVERMKDKEYDYDIRKRESERQLLETKGQIEVNLENAREYNKRELLKVESEAKTNLLQVEGNIKANLAQIENQRLDIQEKNQIKLQEINNQHQVNLENITTERKN